MKNFIYLFRYMLCIGLLMKVSICYSQEEYEYVNTSSWKWSSNSELLFYYNSTEKLLVANNNALTEEEKKQHSFTMRITGMDIPVKKGNSYTISFNIKNEHNPRLYKYKVNGVDKKGDSKKCGMKQTSIGDLVFNVEIIMEIRKNLHKVIAMEKE